MEELVAELRRRYDVYYVLPKMTAHWNNQAVHGRWVELLGQNVLRLEDPAGICELIASTIGVAEGKVDLADLADDLQEAGASASVAQAVRRAHWSRVDDFRDAVRQARAAGLTRAVERRPASGLNPAARLERLS